MNHLSLLARRRYNYGILHPRRGHGTYDLPSGGFFLGPSIRLRNFASPPAMAPKRKRTSTMVAGTGSGADEPPALTLPPTGAALVNTPEEAAVLARRTSTRKKKAVVYTEDVLQEASDAEDDVFDGPLTELEEDGQVDEKPTPKKKRRIRKKATEPIVYDIPPVETLETTFKGALSVGSLAVCARLVTVYSWVCLRSSRIRMLEYRPTCTQARPGVLLTDASDRYYSEARPWHGLLQGARQEECGRSVSSHSSRSLYAHICTRWNLITYLGVSSGTRRTILSSFVCRRRCSLLHRIRSTGTRWTTRRRSLRYIHLEYETDMSNRIETSGCRRSCEEIRA